MLGTLRTLPSASVMDWSIGLHQVAAVDHGGGGRDELNRSHLEALAKGGPSAGRCSRKGPVKFSLGQISTLVSCSPCISMPVLSRKAEVFHIVENFSAPSRSPMAIKAGLQEFATALPGPGPVAILPWQRMGLVRPGTVTDPVQLK